MARLSQRHGITQTARNGNIMRRRTFWQIRQAGTIGGQRRTIIAESHFQLILAGNSAHGRGHCPLERFGINRPVFTLARIIAYC